MEKVIVILGETAVGKTAMSLRIAKAINSEIINGDAMQVYKELNILTDKLPLEFQRGIPHHLLNIKSIKENYSVEEYQRNIREVISQLNKKNIIPIIVGGTGLYIKAALYDYDFQKESIPNDQIEKSYENYTNDQLYEMLLKIDPKSCEKIHKNNRRRVIRALNIYSSTGQTKSEIIDSQKHELLYDALIIGLYLDRDELLQRIDYRIDEMFERNVILEVKNNPTDTTASKAIGYQEISSYLKGETTLDEAIKLMKIHTHQYSKRQKTFFKNQFDINWIENNEEAFDKIMALISEKFG